MRLGGDDPDVRAAVAASATLAAAVGVFGLSFGVGAVDAGASVWQACAMSLLVFTGASQFSATSVVANGGTTGAALGGALLLAARNAVYGLAMARIIRGRLGTRLVAAQLTIDESTAMATAQCQPHARRVAFWVSGIGLYVVWNLSTLAGALAGGAIDPETYGLDAAFPAAYVAMVWPHLRTPTGRVAAALGAVICLVLTPLTPVGVPILAAAGVILIGLRTPGATRSDEAASSG